MKDTQRQLLLKNDLIRVSNSPWSTSVTLQNKSDGSKRLCVDYRRLNAISIGNKAPMPLVFDIHVFDKLRDAKLFTTLDIASRFWHKKCTKIAYGKLWTHRRNAISTKNKTLKFCLFEISFSNV